jgi:hypothetical protein
MRALFHPWKQVMYENMTQCMASAGDSFHHRQGSSVLGTLLSAFAKTTWTKNTCAKKLSQFMLAQSSSGPPTVTL